VNQNYLMTRRLLYGAARYTGTTQAECDRMVTQAAQDALDELDCIERQRVIRNRRYLQDMIEGLGPAGGLELLAAVSEFVEKGNK
jgi:hypothetical protein